MAKAPQTVDIRAKFQAAFGTALDFTGSFSYAGPVTNDIGTNPCIAIEGIGAIGLPLSQRDAVAIKSVAKQTLFEKKERTDICDSVKDTWEVDPKKIIFENPHWETVISNAVASVCAVLEINKGTATPRYELHKLMMYETGSHFLPRIGAEGVNGSLGTIVIVLPSKFTGGEVNLSHNGRSSTYNNSAGSHYQTIIMGWHTDVMHELKPITSGHRLALVYNLIRPQQSLRPTVSLNHAFTQNVRDALIAWNNNQADGPKKLVCLLTHRCEQHNLRASALGKGDEHKTAIMSTLAKELGFHLGLANVEFHLEGTAGSEYGYGTKKSRRSHRYNHFDLSDDSDDHLEFDGTPQRTFRIEGNLVDLNGFEITDSLKLKKTELVPSSFYQDIENGPCDEEEYESRGCNWLERWYRRTVLVVWPEKFEYEILYSGVPTESVLEEMHDTDIPAAERFQIAEYLLRNAKQDRPKMVKSVTELAIDDKDYKLWNLGVSACEANEALTVLSGEDVTAAILNFGLDKVKQTIERVLKEDSSNQRRHDLLQYLESQINERSEDFPEGTGMWIKEQTQTLLSTLKHPVEGEHALLVQLSVDNGGVEFFRKSLLPQVKSELSWPLLLQLAIEISTDERLPSSPVKAEVIQDLLETGISAIPFHVEDPYSLIRPPACDGNPQGPEEGLLQAKIAFDACEKAGSDDSIRFLLSGLTKASSGYRTDARRRVAGVVLPFLGHLHEQKKVAKLTGLHDALYNKLWQAVVEMYLTWTSHHATLIFDQQSIDAFFQYSLWHNNDEMFFKIALPKLSDITRRSRGIDKVFRKLYDCQSQFSPPEGYSGISTQAVISELVGKCIKGITERSDTHEDTLNIFEAILHVGDHTAAMTYVNNILGYRKWVSTSDVVDSVGLLINSLRSLIDQYGKETLAPLCSRLAHYWFTSVLSKEPEGDCSREILSISQWDCACQHCEGIKRFLLTSPDSKLRLNVGATTLSHIEGYLEQHAKLAASSFSFGTNLTITKCGEFLALQSWKPNQMKGERFLQQLGSPEDLKFLLGDRYDVIVTTLQSAKRKDAPSADVPNGTGSSITVSGGPGPSKKRKVVA